VNGTDTQRQSENKELLMYWRLDFETIAEDAAATPPAGARRFVLHRHRDAAGPHLDLRLEQEQYLLGWRIDAREPGTRAWATEKAPHPLHWLEQDGDATREEAGVYDWEQRDAAGGTLLLWGRRRAWRVQVRAEAGLVPGVVRAVCERIAAHGLPQEQVAALIDDGIAARQRAIARFCGLGRELDGDAFDAAVWRGTLKALTLEDIHRHLRAYELRFDTKYPPQPVSRPEALSAEAAGDRSGAVLEILRG